MGRWAKADVLPTDGGVVRTLRPPGYGPADPQNIGIRGKTVDLSLTLRRQNLSK